MSMHQWNESRKSLANALELRVRVRKRAVMFLIHVRIEIA